MAWLLRQLGIGGPAKRGPGTGDTETVRRIAARLEGLDPAHARYLASFAYVLARVAHADLRITETETDAMLRIVQESASLREEEAALVVEIAKSQARLLGETENYVVTREFRSLASREQRARLLDCLYRVAAADGTISSEESAEIATIAEELGFTRPEVNAIRTRYREFLAELQDLPGRGGGSAPASS